MDFETVAKRIINTELSRRGLNKEQLAQKLNDAGFQVTAHSVRNKINYGAFSFAFFLQCMKVIDAKNISLDDLYRE